MLKRPIHTLRVNILNEKVNVYLEFNKFCIV